MSEPFKAGPLRDQSLSGVNLEYTTPSARTVYQLSENSNNQSHGINQTNQPFELTLGDFMHPMKKYDHRTE